MITRIQISDKKRIQKTKTLYKRKQTKEKKTKENQKAYHFIHTFQ